LSGEEFFLREAKQAIKGVVDLDGLDPDDRALFQRVEITLDRLIRAEYTKAIRRAAMQDVETNRKEAALGD